MGSKLENVRSGLEQTKENVENGIEKASEDAAEMQAVRDALAEVPSDADDDLVALVDTVEESSKGDAVDSMENNAHRDIESAHDTGAETQEEAEEGEQTSNEAASAYSEVAGTRFAGEAADAQSQAESSAEEFAEMNSETEETLSEGDAEYERFLNEIMGG